MRQQLRTVIFDLDDTLLDSFDARVAALAQVFAEAGVTHVAPGDFVRKLMGQQLQGLLESLKAEVGTQVDLFTQYRRAYWLNDTPRALYPGVRELLERLQAGGVSMGVVTQKERLFDVDGQVVGAAKELAQVGIDGFIGVTVGFEDVTRHKPHPEGIELALATLEASPEETLVVGDSAADILAANAAGCRSCHATWGLPDGCATLGEARPHLVADSPAGVLRIMAGAGTPRESA